MLMKLPDGFGDFAVLSVPVAIYEEEVFPCLALARTALDLRHVEPIAAEGREGIMKCADLVRDAEHETRPIVAGRRWALASEHKEPGGVGGARLAGGEAGFDPDAADWAGGGCCGGGAVPGRRGGGVCDGDDDYGGWRVGVAAVRSVHQSVTELNNSL